MKVCIINLGLYRTGSTTLAKAAQELGMKVNRDFPQSLSSDDQIQMLEHPDLWIKDNFIQNTSMRNSFLKDIETFDYLGDGFMPLLMFLSPQELKEVCRDAEKKSNKKLIFVATTRDEEGYVASELHHWVRHDLEAKAGMEKDERSKLEAHLRNRYQEYNKAMQDHHDASMILELPLSMIDKWPKVLAKEVKHASSSEWKNAFSTAGVQNANPTLPLEGILLTMRLGGQDEDASTEACESIMQLLQDLEDDSLCRYMIVLGLDSDEYNSPAADRLVQTIQSRPRLQKLCVIENPSSSKTTTTKNETCFSICQVWDVMANRAWEEGASWVVLLGDDVRVTCSFHYRDIYRSFLKIAQEHNCEFGFGCPWFDDSTFPGFPTFPVVGCLHYKIFGSLIPLERKSQFVNQDLDPYLQRLYLQYGAAPPLQASLTNGKGGNDLSDARYQRVPASGWKHWVMDDVELIEKYIEDQQGWKVERKLLVDIIVPSYRVQLEYLERIVSIAVPDNMRSTFIIIVDNPKLLIEMANVAGAATAPKTTKEISCGEAAMWLEQHLLNKNNIRVRCNEENMGAAASRNRGIDESAAEYILFLDDDVKPDPNILVAYSASIQERDMNDLSGILGMVRFPRRPDLPLIHAAVLMSYLVFMFEIAENPLYQHPAWGVTANLLVKRRPTVRFDDRYAKTGGGEDVDFCLRLGGKMIANPQAAVTHEYWQGNALSLSRHFFCWAIGDGALFSRFPELCYRSWPNAAETIAFSLVYTATTVTLHLHPLDFLLILYQISLILVCDFAVDLCHPREWQNRRRLLKYPRSNWFVGSAFFLGNLYIVVLEAGRMYGHCKRGQLRNLLSRFDWHCGRLKNAPENFVRRESIKFAFFFLVIFITRQQVN